MIEFKDAELGEIEVYSECGVYVGELQQNTADKYLFNNGFSCNKKKYIKTGNDYIAIGHKLNELNGVNDGST